MRIAIIVPTYDEEAGLPAQISHVRALIGGRDDVEVVVVDGGSRDGTRALLADSGIAWITAPRGRAAQMNAGAAASTGDVLLFLHADTRLPEGAIDAVSDAVRAGAGAGFFRVRLESSRPLLRLVGRAISLRSRLTGIATGDQAIWVRRERFDAIGGYPPVPLFEDLELCGRLREEVGLTVLPLPVRTSARRWEGAGAWRTILRMWLLRGAYRLGVAPARLARHYGVAR